MDEGWQLTYEVHYVSFGIAFLLLAGLCLRAAIRARNTSIVAKSRVHYAVNAVFVMFTTSRALILLLHRYVNEGAIQLSFERFLFNLGFPCLITAYTSICYNCVECLKDDVRHAFYLVVSQCYLVIIADILIIAMPMVPYNQHVILNIDHVLIFCSFLCGLLAIIVYAKTFFSDSSDISNDMKKSNVDIMERQDCAGTKATDMNGAISSNGEQIVTFVILCVGISCAVILLCIMAGIFKVCDNDMDMESWYSWMYVNVLRMLELGNAAMMSYLVHCITLKRKSLLL